MWTTGRVARTSRRWHQSAQRHGLMGGHGHALTVDGINGADRVTDDSRLVGECTQALVAVVDARRSTVLRARPLDVAAPLAVPAPPLGGH